jgi:hypothetical protein
LRAASGVLRAVGGAAFVLAGAGKLAGGGPRVGPVLLGTAPGPVVLAAAVLEVAVPWLELLTGLALWAGVGRVAAHVLGLVLGALFLAVALTLPEGVRCGCFGALGAFESRAGHLAVAGGLTTVVLASFLVGRKSFAVNELRYERRTDVPEAT